MKRDFDVDATAAAAANVEQLSKIAKQQEQQLFSQAVIQLHQQQQQ